MCVWNHSHDRYQENYEFGDISRSLLSCSMFSHETGHGQIKEHAEQSSFAVRQWERLRNPSFVLSGCVETSASLEQLLICRSFFFFARFQGRLQKGSWCHSYGSWELQQSPEAAALDSTGNTFGSQHHCMLSAWNPLWQFPLLVVKRMLMPGKRLYHKEIVQVEQGAHPLWMCGWLVPSINGNMERHAFRMRIGCGEHSKWPTLFPWIHDWLLPQQPATGTLWPDRHSELFSPGHAQRGAVAKKTACHTEGWPPKICRTVRLHADAECVLEWLWSGCFPPGDTFQIA